MEILLKRAYEPATAEDGCRILVDRLWPRGIAKDRARLFSWCREIAPSDALRHWFHANPDRWPEFEARYRAELAAQGEMIDELAGYTQDGIVTLIYASKDEERNNAVVLRDVLRERIGKGETRDG